METDRNPMPDIDPLPRLKAVGRFFLDILHSPLPSHLLASHGDHVIHEHIAEIEIVPGPAE